MEPQPRTQRRDPIGPRLGMVAVELAILGAAWWFLGLALPLVGAIAAVIIIGGVVPMRFSTLVSGIGLAGLAALVYFYFGNQPLAMVLAVGGLLMIAVGIARLKRP